MIDNNVFSPFIRLKYTSQVLLFNELEQDKSSDIEQQPPFGDQK